MLVLYATPHAHGAACLEAALIDRFRSYLIAIFLTDSTFDFTVVRTCAADFLQLFWTFLDFGLGFVPDLCPDMQGSKNERSGGDSVKEIDGGPYLTYIVYKSWKVPGLRVRSVAK